MNPTLSIVIPSYNEGKNILHVFRAFALLNVAYSSTHPFELIFVDNGSTDLSHDVIADLLKDPVYHFISVVHVPRNIGYGHGIMSGLRQAKGEYLCWTHGDLQTPPGDCFKAFDLLLTSGDPERTVVKGRRTGRPWGEWFFTFGMSVISTLVLGRVLFDVNAQPKVFHRSFLSLMVSAPDDFSLDLYWLYTAKKKGYTLSLLPVYFRQRMHGVSRWAFSLSSRLRTIWRTVRYIFHLRSLLTSDHALHHSSR